MFSYAKMFEKSALATLLHFARVTLTHQPHVYFDPWAVKKLWGLAIYRIDVI